MDNLDQFHKKLETKLINNFILLNIKNVFLKMNMLIICLKLTNNLKT